MNSRVCAAKPVATPGSVIDRIKELTALDLERPQTFTPEILGGILAAVEQNEAAASRP